MIAFCGTTVSVLCQDADSSFPRTRAEGERCLREQNVCEQLEKLRIAHDKKEHDELLARAEEALRLSEELERSITTSDGISDQNRSKLQDFEKIVRKIRSELGAKDADPEKKNEEDGVADEAEDVPEEKRPVDVVSGFKILRESTIKLVNEVRKTTRFSISAAAIQSSNAVLKLTKLLRFWR